MNAPSSGKPSAAGREAPRAPELAEELALVRRIVLDGLRGQAARVYLIGSAARGEARHVGGRGSDIDVAVLPLAPLPTGLLAGVRETLEESNLLRVVDLVDLSQTSAEFRSRALEEGAPWNA